jgi:hypothetical protein
MCDPTESFAIGQHIAGQNDLLPGHDAVTSRNGWVSHSRSSRAPLVSVHAHATNVCLRVRAIRIPLRDRVEHHEIGYAVSLSGGCGVFLRSDWVRY